MNSKPPVRFSQRWEWGSRQAISFLMQQGAENPQVLSLAAGLVDAATLPVELTQSLASELLADPAAARAALQYGSTSGSTRLRDALQGHLAQLEGCSVSDLGITRDQLLLTTGSQQLLSLICEILFDPGDIALVAAPTYFGFLGTLAGVGARAIPVASDQDGMCVEALERTLEELATQGELSKVKLIYVVSDFENPSGVCLSGSRRERVVELARQYSRPQRIFVLEDAAYRELRYYGEPIRSLWSFDPAHEFVILAQTFSKSYSPGLRVGYGVLPQELVPALIDRKGNEDFGSAHFNQNLLAVGVESGRYQQHVAGLRDSYRIKRDAIVAAAEKYFGDIPGVSWWPPSGGLYLWMSLPEGSDTRFEGELFQHAVREEQVMYVPGHLCYPGPMEVRPRHQMRLSFGVLSPQEIDTAMLRLSRSVRYVLGLPQGRRMKAEG